MPATSKMRVRFLGSGTAIPTAERSYAAIHVQIADRHILLDAGPGTLAKLAKSGVTYLDLHSLWLSHAHPDHCLDLVSILFAMRIPRPARRAAFTVYGPKGTKRLYQRLNAALNGWLTPRTYALLIRELGVEKVRGPGFTVQTARMDHSAPALGYRVEAAGRSLVYSGDTDVCSSIIELGREADVLILECSMTDERKVEGHLTPSECGRIAAEARCKRLVLTHFYPVFDGYDIRGRVRRHYKGPVALAKDFMAIDV